MRRSVLLHARSSDLEHLNGQRPSFNGTIAISTQNQAPSSNSKPLNQARNLSPISSHSLSTKRNKSQNAEHVPNLPNAGAPTPLQRLRLRPPTQLLPGLSPKYPHKTPLSKALSLSNQINMGGSCEEPVTVTFEFILVNSPFSNQVLEETRRQTKRAESRRIDSTRFKLSKPISKDHDRAKSKKRKQWWKSAFSFLKRTKGGSGEVTAAYPYPAVTGPPVYVTESVSGRSTPCRNARSTSGTPLWAAEFNGEAAVTPYVSLRRVNVTDGHRISASNASPIYLVN